MTLFTQGALEVNLTGGATWTDITPYMTGPLQVVQGRPDEWSQITPGIMTVTLKNFDARFMPGLSSSPYYPNFVPEKQIRWWVRMAGNWYIRFWGYIKAIEPAFPGNSTNHAVVKISAVDNLGICAGKKLYSHWIFATRFDSIAAGAHWDGFITNNADGVAAGYLDNVTDATGTKAVATVVPAAGGVGELTYGGADGLSIEGSIGFHPASNRNGAVVHITSITAGNARGVAFWVKFPGTNQTSAGSAQRDVISFYNGGTRIGLLRLTLNGTNDDLGFFTGANVFVAPTIGFTVADNRWHMVTLRTKTATPTTTDVSFDGGAAINFPMDLRTCTEIWLGGIGTVLAEMEMAGVVVSGSENGLPLAVEGYSAGGIGNLAARIIGLQWAVPVTLGTITGGDYTTQTQTGNWHGRTVLDVMQEQMRTTMGFWWARSYDSRLTAVPLASTYPLTPLVTLDAEGHMLGTLELREGVESVPTRVIVEYPGGQVTAIDAAAETTAQSQIRPRTVTTVAANATDAGNLAATMLGNATTRLRISSFTLDLETATSDTVAALFNSAGELPGLFPTQRIRLTLPSSHFNPSTVDAFVEGWTEVYDGAGGCRITFDLSA